MTQVSRYYLDMNKNYISQVLSIAELNNLAHPKQTLSLRQTRASGSQFTAFSLSTKSGEISAGNSSLKSDVFIGQYRTLDIVHTYPFVFDLERSILHKKNACQQVSLATRKGASLGSSHQNFLEVLNPHWHSDLRRIDRLVCHLM